MSHTIPMATRVRMAGDQAVPMLVDIHIKVGAEACQALCALQHNDGGPPDVEEAARRLNNILRLLFTGVSGAAPPRLRT